MRAVRPYLSGKTMKENVTVWFLAAVVYFCEFVGGFSAVCFTDAVQSVIVIFSMVALGSTVAYYHSGAAGSVEHGCEVCLNSLHST